MKVLGETSFKVSSLIYDIDSIVIFYIIMWFDSMNQAGRHYKCIIRYQFATFIIV